MAPAIRTGEEHRAALRTIEAPGDAAEGTPEGDRPDLRVASAESHENKRWPVRAR